MAVQYFVVPGFHACFAGNKNHTTSAVIASRGPHDCIYNTSPRAPAPLGVLTEKQAVQFRCIIVTAGKLWRERSCSDLISPTNTHVHHHQNDDPTPTILTLLPAIATRAERPGTAHSVLLIGGGPYYLYMGTRADDMLI